jgi:NAD(P)-dependent dehydrogenase (short-subunit alcohol dehydrogenase family)
VGGASGIGAACAEGLRNAGWPVVVVDLRPDDGDPSSMRVDVRDYDAVGTVVDRVVAHHGGLGAVVYAAGTARVTPILEIEPAEWELVRSVNLDGAYNVLRQSALHLPLGGSFTLISSVDSAAPVDGLAHYSAAKAGAEALVRGAALELGERGIRCNSVLPGVVRTPLMAPQLERPGVSEAFIAQTPLGRIADGEEIAEVVCFLASSAARWITGVSLAVDGGMSLREHPRLLTGAEPDPNGPLKGHREWQLRQTR